MSTNQNFATLAQAKIEKSICGRCTKPIITAMHAHRVQMAAVTPATAVYIVKRIIETRTVIHQHVRPQEFFNGRQLNHHAALVGHECTCSGGADPTQLFADFNRDDNTQTGYTQTITACEFCKEPIVWSTARPRAGEQAKRIPMDLRQRVLIIKAGTPHPTFQTPREFFDDIAAGGSPTYSIYAACAAHHAFCPPYQAAQAAARSRG